MVKLTVNGGTVNVNRMSYRKGQSFELDESEFDSCVKQALACGQLKADSKVKTPLTPALIPKSRENVAADQEAQEEIPMETTPDEIPADYVQEPDEPNTETIDEPVKVIKPRPGKTGKRR